MLATCTVDLATTIPLSGVKGSLNASQDWLSGEAKVGIEQASRPSRRSSQRRGAGKDVDQDKAGLKMFS
jgi:hypothetical protein